MPSEPMDARVRWWVADILEDHPDLIALAVRQRATWEGWLKLELAARARREGCAPVSVEAGYGQGRADVTLHEGGTRYDIELKTATANWRMPGVRNATRPITMNIAGVVADARKLESAPGRGIVCFALFPVPTGSGLWLKYLDRSAEALGAPLSEAGHCTRARVDLGGGDACEVVICAFAYPHAVSLPQPGR